MRLPLLFLTALLVAGCGQPAADGADTGGDSVALGGDVTLDLPPPEEVTAAPAKAPPARPEPAPAVPATPREPPARVGPGSLVPSAPPIAAEGLAGYITRAGFECDAVTATSRLQDANGRAAGIFKFDCATGGSYQGTMRRGHLYFRPWSGQPGAG